MTQEEFTRVLGKQTKEMGKAMSCSPTVTLTMETTRTVKHTARESTYGSTVKCMTENGAKARRRATVSGLEYTETTT